ncbi:MAG: BrnT family toxin [Terracidiphilus sp.]
MRYEWDERKNRENRRKHNISFNLAALVFEDESCLIDPERVDEAGEQRWHALGAVSIEPGAALVLIVVHVYRENCDGEESIRILSARRAGTEDVRRYKEQEVD